MEDRDLDVLLAAWADAPIPIGLEQRVRQAFPPRRKVTPTLIVAALATAAALLIIYWPQQIPLPPRPRQIAIAIPSMPTSTPTPKSVSRKKRQSSGSWPITKEERMLIAFVSNHPDSARQFINAGDFTWKEETTNENPDHRLPAGGNSLQPDAATGTPD